MPCGLHNILNGLSNNSCFHIINWIISFKCFIFCYFQILKHDSNCLVIYWSTFWKLLSMDVYSRLIYIMKCGQFLRIWFQWCASYDCNQLVDSVVLTGKIHIWKAPWLSTLTCWGWVTYICIKLKPILIQMMACHLDAKPLTEPMLTYCQLDWKEHISMKTNWKFKEFDSIKFL